MQGGAGPPFRNPPSAPVQGGAGPPFRNPPSAPVQGGAGPPFRNPPSVWDIGWTCGPSLRVWGGVWKTREDGLTQRAEPDLTATRGPSGHWGRLRRIPSGLGATLVRIGKTDSFARAEHISTRHIFLSPSPLAGEVAR